MGKSKEVRLVPGAFNLIESIRSVGYTFETALSDIIDNSISANAKNVNIVLEKSSNEPIVQIIDDGLGMSYEELLSALTLGSKNPLEDREINDLGRFGIGLKSASFSQCRKLTVISKKDGVICGAYWDLDYVLKINDFIVNILEDSEIISIPNIERISDLTSGTMIIWENFDRLEDSSHDVFDEISAQMSKAIDHISLIFHRYISDGCNFKINNQKIEAKDPFLRKHKGTQELIKKSIKVDGQEITLFPVVLPHYSNLSAQDKRSSGKINDHFNSQGFYIYRNKRLIIWGDYLGLTNRNELAKNLRIQVDLPNSLDYLWSIDIKKSKASVPSKLKKNLLSAINDGEIVSKKVNTYKGFKNVVTAENIWDIRSDREETFFMEINKANALYLELQSTLSEEQSILFNTYVSSLESNIPFQRIYAEIASGNQTKVNEDEELLKDLYETIKELESLKSTNLKSILKTLINTSPYSSSEKAREIIINLIGEHDDKL